MISCPKCNFQQPKDRFCAKCGIDINTYKPPTVSYATLISGILKPLLIFAGIIFIVSVALKSLNKKLNVDFDFGTFDQDTPLTIGTQADSVRVENTNTVATQSTKEPLPAAARSAAPDITPQANTQVKATVEKIIPEQYISISIVEAFIPENLREQNKALLTDDPQILNTFFSDNGVIQKDPFTTRYEDELMTYEISVTVTEHKDQKNTFTTIIKRSLKTPQAAVLANIETTDTMELDGFSIIKDMLPREQRLQPLTPLLNSLSQSQSYLARSSELAVTVKFEPIQTEGN